MNHQDGSRGGHVHSTHARQPGRRRRARALALSLVAWIGLGSAVALLTAAPASAAAITTVMTKGQKLRPGHAVRSATVQAACDSYYWELRMQTDGNLVERQVFPCLGTRSVYWQTQTSERRAHLLLNRRGNLVLVKRGRPVWRTGTGRLGVTHLVIGSDGNMEMRTRGGAVRWSSRWGVCSKEPLSNGKQSTIVSTACRAAGYSRPRPHKAALSYCLDGGGLKPPYRPDSRYCPDRPRPHNRPYPTRVVDCSGLTRWAVNEALPRTTLDHFAYDQDNNQVALYHGTRIAESHLLPGDLVFFYGGDAPHPGHVGIYIGKGYVIDAFDYGYRVAIHSISWENIYGAHNPNSSSNYMGAVRYW